MIDILRNIFLTFVIIFLGPPMFIAELITRRTIRWRSSLQLALWCLLCWTFLVGIAWLWWKL
jgi:hypothetical protein